jgi:predicted acyltransferase
MMASSAHKIMDPNVPAAAPIAASAKPLPERLTSLDAYRGFIMLVMASGGLGIFEVSKKFPDSRVWQTLGYHFHHVNWLGCAFWDLIQPSFMFMVGVAMAYSYAARQAHGQSYPRMLLHAMIRSVVLVLLGVFLRSGGGPQTNFTFMDVVSQIGLGYTFLFLLWGKPPWLQGAAAAVILAGYWLWFALYPLPPEEFDYATVGVSSKWQHLEGLAAHWDKGTNAAANFDVWLLNQFPRVKPFAYESSGYPTLNFIPSLATMIFGLMAGELLRRPRSKPAKFWMLVACGAASMAAGKALDLAGICPIVKIIWTPAWTLYSTGSTLLLLSGFYAVIDIAGFRRWSFPFLVVGMNSITMYVMASLLSGWFRDRLKIHFGQDLFPRVSEWLHLGEIYVPIVEHVLVLFAMWLVCLWLYRQRIFIRI